MHDTVDLTAKYWQIARLSTQPHAHRIRNVGQGKYETGNRLGLYGLTLKTKYAPLKLETLHEFTGQLP